MQVTEFSKIWLKAHIHFTFPEIGFDFPAIYNSLSWQHSVLDAKEFIPFVFTFPYQLTWGEGIFWTSASLIPGTVHKL